MTDDEELSRILRSAAAGDLTPGASERIAARAWERAAALRATPPRRGLLRRMGFLAAAAAVIAVAAFALRGPETAFAVEGDPVMVRRGDAWVETRSVPVNVLVSAPAGARVLRSRAGDVLVPRPGSLFRFAVDVAAKRPVYRAEFVEGGGDVSGACVVVSMGDEIVVERDPRAASFHFSFSLGDGAPRIEVESGRAVARARGSGERLSLAAAEKAAYLSVSMKGAVERRLAKLESWSDAAATRISAGSWPVLDAEFDGKRGLTLVGGTNAEGLLAFDVPMPDVRAALRCVNDAAAIRTFMTMRPVTASVAPRAHYVYEKDAVRVTLDVAVDGTVRVESGGGETRFASVAAFRREAPGLASLFGDELR